MVSPVQYLRTHTGIDLSLPAGRQSLSAVDDAALREFIPGTEIYSTPSHAEAIYDTVVGVDRVSNCGFDRTSDAPERLRAPELARLARIVRDLQSRDQASRTTVKALSEMEVAATTYQHLLQGDPNVPWIPKDPRGLGNRHSLIRSNQGAVFEMLNSMDDAEVARIRRKTGMQINAVEQPVSTRIVDGAPMHKIELGKGAFGKARIARNIMSDTYVAVKKAHPKIDLCQERGMISQPVSEFRMAQFNARVDFSLIRDAVIAPTDDCIVDSSGSEAVNCLATDLNQLRAGVAPEAKARVARSPLLAQLYKEYDTEDVNTALVMALDPDMPSLRTDLRSQYSFSELGMTSVGAFVEHFNVIRFHLERCNAVGELSSDGLALMRKHVACFDATPINGVSDTDLAYLQASLGIRRFAQADFKLKDAVYNQRFLNTLGRDMLAALHKLHTHPDARLSHRDIKPDNIVLCQDADRNIRPKLIDLDIMEKQTAIRAMPDAGCRAFMPPEALIEEKDESISYDGQKADAYAMGASLRLLVGFGMKEVAAIGDLHKVEATVEWMDAQKTLKKNREFAQQLSEGKKELKSLALEGDNRIQNQLRVHAILQAVPEAVTLKDIADLMLKVHPGKRCLPTDVLALPFFDNPDNFLPRAEFTRHANDIMRFMQLIDKEEVVRINDMQRVASKNLQEVRRAAAHAALANRGQTPGRDALATLSKSETKKVDSAEQSLQAAALLRRGMRALTHNDGAGASIADRKLNYVRRFPPR